MSLKAYFYLENFIKISVGFLFKSKLKNFASEVINSSVTDKEILSRVDYYISMKNSFELCDKSISIKEFNLRDYPSMPSIDLLRVLQYFPDELRFNTFLFDFKENFKIPTIVKCRPVGQSAVNCVLLKLNKFRFFNFPKDDLVFLKKTNTAIFRGACHKTHRKCFVETNYRIPKTDIKDTRKESRGKPYFSAFTTVKEQLRHKFIISIEGNDVASNLPWIMASNSIAFMTKPKFEGWFMQGRLIPNYHYVLLKDDYSDLEEKIDYYSSNEAEAHEINHNAKKHVAQFFDKRTELITSLLVLEKYFRLSGQMD